MKKEGLIEDKSGNSTPMESTGSFYAQRIAHRKPGLELDPPFPETVMIELTNGCNHACVFCTNPRMSRAVSHLPIELFTSFITEAVSLGVKEAGFYTTGEPFMTPNLDEFVKIATDAGVAYTYITTNGSLATPDKLERLIRAGIKSIKFSINAGLRESYKLVHGSDDFERVLENVRWRADYRKANGTNLRLLGSCVLTRLTENEKELHRATFGPYLDDILYVCAGPQASQSLLEAQLVTPSYNKIKFPAEGTRAPCFMLWSRVHLTAEGYLSLCCVDYNNNLVYARVDDGKPLMEHWHNAIVTEMRKRHLSQELKGTLCHNCFYGGTDPYVPISDLGRTTRTQPARVLKKGPDLQTRISKISEMVQQQG